MQDEMRENLKSIELLEAIGGSQPPQNCLYELINFNFPRQRVLRSSRKDAQMATGLVLEQISKIFNHNFTQTEWNVDTIENFQNDLHQRSGQWKRCAGEKAMFQDPGVQVNLLKYFLRINKFLNDHNYSLCAWEAVRQEIWRRCFVVLAELRQIFIAE